MHRLAYLCALIGLMAGCTDPIVGEWEFEEGDFTSTLFIESDGTGEWESKENGVKEDGDIDWKKNGDDYDLEVDWNGQTLDWECKVRKDGDELSCDGDELDGGIDFDRVD